MADGKAVKVRFTIPVMFSLSKKQNGNTPNMNIPELTVPSGQEVTNKSLEGVWQSCLVQPGAHDFRIALLPVLKVISADKTFINIMTRGRDAKSNAIIFSQESIVCLQTACMSRYWENRPILFSFREQRMKLVLNVSTTI